MKVDSVNRFLGAGFISAFAASLCCITPVVSLITGAGGIAATFSWIEPLRPYVIGLTVATLGFAWYQKLKVVKQPECDCAEIRQPSFFHSIKFLTLVSIASFILLTFPFYAASFYPTAENNNGEVNSTSTQQAEFKIGGMTCTACAEHIQYEVNTGAGILTSEVSYENGLAIIKFDGDSTSLEEIVNTIESTGYSVVEAKIK